MVKDYSNVPVVATITCTAESGITFNLFKTNLTVGLKKDDQLKLKLETSTELIYYTQLCANTPDLSIVTA